MLWPLPPKVYFKITVCARLRLPRWYAFFEDHPRKQANVLRRADTATSCWDTVMPCAHLVAHTLVRHLPVIEGQCALTSPRTTGRSTSQANEQIRLYLRIQIVTSPAHRKHSSRKSPETFRAILSVSQISATSIMTDETGE